MRKFVDAVSLRSANLGTVSVSSEAILDINGKVYPANTITKRIGDDLVIIYADGTQEILEDYFLSSEEQTSEESEEIAFEEKKLDQEQQADEESLEATDIDVVQHIDQPTEFSGLLTQAEAGAATETVETSTSGSGATGTSSLSAVAVGVVAAGAAAGGGGAGGGIASVAAAFRTMGVSVVFGPMNDEGVGTEVILYDDEGNEYIATYNSATNLFEVSIPSAYTGIFVVVVRDMDDTPDYVDEATGQPTNIGASSVTMSVVNYSGSTSVVQVNEVTTTAAKELGIDPDNINQNALPSPEEVQATNEAVGKALGLVDENGDGVDVSTAPVNPTVNTDGSATTDANAYGKVLAALSEVRQSQNDMSIDELTDNLRDMINVEPADSSDPTTAGVLEPPSDGELNGLIADLASAVAGEQELMALQNNIANTGMLLEEGPQSVTITLSDSSGVKGESSGGTVVDGTEYLQAKTSDYSDSDFAFTVVDPSTASGDVETEYYLMGVSSAWQSNADLVSSLVTILNATGDDALADGTYTLRARYSLEENGVFTYSTATETTLLIDRNDPTITELSSPTADGEYSVDSAIELHARVDEAVSVGSQITLTLDTGATVTLTRDPLDNKLFAGTYTIGAGEESNNLTVTSVALGGANGDNKPVDAVGKELGSNLSSAMNLAETSDLVIDTIAPFITNISASAVEGTFGTDSTLTLQLTTSEAMGEESKVIVALDTGATVELTRDQSDATLLTGNYTVGDGETSDNLTVTSVALGSSQSVDNAGNLLELELPEGKNLADNTSLIVDGMAPFITNISASAVEGTFAAGDTIALQLTTNEAVGAGSQIVVTLNTGATVELTRDQSDATLLTGSYIVGDGETSDNLTVTSVALGSSQPVDNAGNPLELELPAGQNLSDYASLIVDGMAPTIASISANTTDGTFGAGNTIALQLTTSEAISEESKVIVTLDTGATIELTRDQSDATLLTGNYTVGDGETSDNLTVTSVALGSSQPVDNAGNLLELELPAGQNLSDNTSLIIDTTAPFITDISASNTEGTLGANDTLTLQLTTNEAMGEESKVIVTLDTGATVELTRDQSDATLLTGNYTVGDGETSDNLTVTSVALGSSQPVDNAGNLLELELPAGQNLSDNTSLIVDNAAPFITNISANNTEGTFGIDSTLTLQLTTNKAMSEESKVIVTLDTGATVELTRDQSDATLLTGNYTVGDGETSDNLTVTSVALGSSQPVDNAGNLLEFELPEGKNLADNTSLIIDTIAPSITNISASNTEGTFGTDSTLTLQLTTSKAMSEESKVVVTLDTGATVELTRDQSDATLLTGNYTVGDGETSDNLTVTSVALGSSQPVDNAGNPLELELPEGKNLADNTSLVIDTTAPFITSFSVSNDLDAPYNNFGIGDQIVLHVTTSAAMNENSKLTITLNNGNTAELTRDPLDATLFTGTLVLSNHRDWDELTAVELGTPKPVNDAGTALKFDSPINRSANVLNVVDTAPNNPDPNVDNVIQGTSRNDDITVDVGDNMNIVEASGGSDRIELLFGDTFSRNTLDYSTLAPGTKISFHYGNYYWGWITYATVSKLDSDGVLRGVDYVTISNDDDRLKGDLSIKGTDQGDTFKLDHLDANSTFYIYIHGGDGIDSYSFAGSAGSFLALSFDTSVMAAEIDLSRSDKQVINDGYGNEETITLSGTKVNIIGSAYADKITGNVHNETLYGQGGDDILNGGEGNDTLDGGDGDDTLNGDEGDDNLYGGDGNDTLNGGEGDDTLDGGDGDDAIAPGASVDEDTVYASTGNDSVDYTDSHQGMQVLRYDNLTVGVDVMIDGLADSGSGEGTVTKGDGQNSEVDTLVNVSTALSNLDGSLGMLLYGTSQDDTFDITLNDDQWLTIAGLAGNDSYTINGDKGLVSLVFDGADQSVEVDMSKTSEQITDDGYGNTETITFAGSATILEIGGGVYADTLTGSDKDEVFLFSGGGDTIDGGGGTDRMHYDRAGAIGVEVTSVAVDWSKNETKVTYTYEGATYTDTLINIEEVYSSDNSVILTGTDIDDEFYGEDGNDIVNGGGGNDTLNGGEGNDTLDGGDGNDTLNGGEGDDTLDGGDGNDAIAPGASVDEDTVYASTGNDSVDYTDSHQGMQVLRYDHFTVGVDVMIDGLADSGSGEGTVTKGDGQNSEVDTLVNVSTALSNLDGSLGMLLYGTSQDDTFDITLNDDQRLTIAGLAGNDSYTINGDKGLVSLVFDGADQSVEVDMSKTSEQITDDGYGNTGTITFAGSATILEIGGGNADDLLIGSDKDEFFVGSGGDDTIDGGGGIDRVRYDGFELSNLEIDLSNAEVRVTYTYEDVDYINALINIEEFYGSDNDDLFTGSAGNDTLYGGEGSDTINGGEGSDTLYGGEGSDTINGGEGSDTLYGGEGSDTINGGEGNDILYDGDGIDTLDGGAGNDTLYGGGYGVAGIIPEKTYKDEILDFLNGGDGDDTLYIGNEGGWLHGGAGNDILYGSAGYDYLDGGDGDDILYAGDGDDDIDGRRGDDTIYGDGGADIIYSSWGNDEIYGGTGNDKIWAEGNNDIVYGDEGDDILDGGQGNDTLHGGIGNDTLEGGWGNDEIYGDEGNDGLWGDEEDDTLYGGEGDDTLYGGDGSDTLYGGEGNDNLHLGNTWWSDTIVFEATAEANGTDAIHNFEKAQDILNFDAINLDGSTETTDAIATLDSVTYRTTENGMVLVRDNISDLAVDASDNTQLNSGGSDDGTKILNFDLDDGEKAIMVTDSTTEGNSTVYLIEGGQGGALTVSTLAEVHSFDAADYVAGNFII